MDGAFTDCFPDGPTRSPAWRWLSAGRSPGKGGRSLRRGDDPWVDAARRFLARRDQHAVRPDRTDAAIHGAYALSCESDPHLRWRLEALLLTSDPLESVARRCSLHPDAVEAYHALYFACRDRPEAHDWLAVKAVGCGPWNGFGGPQPEGLWKYAAFSGGPVLLDVMIAVTTGRPLPDSVRAACAVNPACDVDRLRLGLKLTTALMTSRSPEEVRSLVAIHDGMSRLPGQGTRVRRGATPLTRLMESFLASQGRRRPSREAPPAAAESNGQFGTRPVVASSRRRTSAASGSVVRTGRD